MNLTELFRARTRVTSAARAWYDALPQPVRLLSVALLIAAFYMAPHWPDVPVLGCFGRDYSRRDPLYTDVAFAW